MKVYEILCFFICLSTLIRNNQIIGHVATAEKMTQTVT